MTKKKAAKPTDLTPLKGIERTVINYIINNAALGGYSGACCDVR